MKRLLFLLLLPSPLLAQVPDTLYTEHAGGRVYVVTQTTMPSGEVITRRSAPMDSTTAARQMFGLIRDNELGQVAGIRQIKEVDALTTLYTDVNAELIRLTGEGYVGQARRFLAENFVGFWSASLSGQLVGIKLNEDGTATQVNAQGQPVQGGLSGSWRPITEQSFQLVAFFPTNVLPVGERIVRISNGSKFFFTLNTSVVFEKL